MRIALLSAMEVAPDAPRVITPQDNVPPGKGTTPRALLPFIGRSIIRRQADIALSLGCERIICLAAGPAPELTQLQHLCDKADVHFHLVTDLRSLSGIVRSADSLVVFGDGVVLADTKSIALLDNASGVLTVSAEEGVPSGFERIDADHAWAGLLRTGGSSIERLADLPSDTDPVSALLRIALQSGAQLLPVSEGLLADGSLALFETAAQIDRGQDSWLNRHFKPRSWFGPGLAVTDRIVGRFANRLIGRGLAGAAGLAAVIALCVIALATGWLWNITAAFVILAFAAMIGAASASLGRLEASEPDDSYFGEGGHADILIDLSLIGVSVGTFSGVLARDIPTDLIFAAFILIAAVRIVKLASGPGWTALLYDRIALCIGLAIAAGFGVLLPAIQIMAVISVGTALFIGYFGRMKRA